MNFSLDCCSCGCVVLPLFRTLLRNTAILFRKHDLSRGCAVGGGSLSFALYPFILVTSALLDFNFSSKCSYASCFTWNLGIGFFWAFFGSFNNYLSSTDLYSEGVVVLRLVSLDLVVGMELTALTEQCLGGVLRWFVLTSRQNFGSHLTVVDVVRRGTIDSTLVSVMTQFPCIMVGLDYPCRYCKVVTTISRQIRLETLRH